MGARLVDRGTTHVAADVLGVPLEVDATAVEAVAVPGVEAVALVLALHLAPGLVLAVQLAAGIALLDVDAITSIVTPSSSAWPASFSGPCSRSPSMSGRPSW